MFKVEWVHEADEQLAAIWTQADSTSVKRSSRPPIPSIGNCRPILFAKVNPETRTGECCLHHRWAYFSASTRGVGSYRSGTSGFTNHVQSNPLSTRPTISRHKKLRLPGIQVCPPGTTLELPVTVRARSAFPSGRQCNFANRSKRFFARAHPAA